MVALRRAALLAALKVGDLVTLTASFVVGAMATAQPVEGATLEELLAIRVPVANFLLFAGLVAAWHVALLRFRVYESGRLLPFRTQAARILGATSTGTATVAVTGACFDISLITPPLLVVLFGTSATVTIASRLALKRFLGLVRARGRNLRHVVIVGTNARALSFARILRDEPERGYHLVGFVDERGRERDAAFAGSGEPLVSDLAGFAEFLRRHVVDEVFVFLPLRSQYERSTRIVEQCEEQGVTVKFLPHIFELKNAHATAEPTDAAPLIAISTGAMSGWSFFLKRPLDAAVAGVLLALLAPLLLVLAALVKATSPGPALFAQERLGLNKRRFRMYKFRTMVVDAERRLGELERLNEASGPVFKIRSDPRVTRFGAFLRKTSLDELPQLFNVLLGDVSLVGPRPLPLRDYAGFEKDWHRRRFSVRPGITCLWQVSGRSGISFDRWMELDLEYIDTWSLWLDVKILARTIPAVLRGTGAM
jgi:exopolysaccharide biosynthesis polyprenyl glycosylphosphotransferase